MLNSIMSYLGSTITPGEAGNQFWALIYIFFILGGVSVAVLTIYWIERKALADVVNAASQTHITPPGVDRFVLWLAPTIGLFAALTVHTVIPFGPSQAVTDMSVGLLFVFGVSLLGVLGIAIAGSASARSPLRALRIGASRLSYKVAMGLAALSAILMTGLNEKGAGTLSLIGIVLAQQDQNRWFIFKLFPLGLIAFLIFVIAMIADAGNFSVNEVEVNPDSELGSDFQTVRSGLRGSLVIFADYATMLAAASIAVTLWLGGWLRPFPNRLSAPVWDVIFPLFPAITFCGLAVIVAVETWRKSEPSCTKLPRIGIAALAAALGFIAMILFVIAIGGRSGERHILSSLRESIGYVYWFVLKVALLIWSLIWFRAARLSPRFDQLKWMGWKLLLPVSLAVLLLTATAGVLVS